MMLSDWTAIEGQRSNPSPESTDSTGAQGQVSPGSLLSRRVIKSATLLFALTLSLCAFSQERTSPFERATTVEETTVAPAQVAPSRLDKMEFTGLLAFGGEVTISLYDTETKESIWVPLDGSEDGISVSGFDEEKGTISVSLQGITREIAINENEIVAVKRAEPAAARPAPAPPKPIRVKDDETLRKEEEARLFVSDLLASGLQQREKFRREREARAAGLQRN